MLKAVHIVVTGIEEKNIFSLIIWDKVFAKEYYAVAVPGQISDFPVLNLSAQLLFPNHRCLIL